MYEYDLNDDDIFMYSYDLSEGGIVHIELGYMEEECSREFMSISEYCSIY